MAHDFEGGRIAHYSISGKIGSGGMGDVYRARDTKLDRDVALKVLPADVAGDPTRLERFQREAKSVAALNHPNIVTIHSVEEADGVHFLTMELIDGESLDRILTHEGLELSKIFDIATPLADALAAAHDRGIIHRDLKPANVMITREGRVKVLDFGLAKLAQTADSSEALTEAETRRAETTSEGTVLGTLPYMSPEQLRGKQVDRRSDIFSLGVMLYEFVMGKRPFAGDTSPDLISSILRDVPPVVTGERQDLPRHLGRIIIRCLEKDPERRFQSAKDVRNELDMLRKEVESGSSEVTPVSSSGRVVAPDAKGRTSLLKIIIPSALVIVAVLAVLILQPFGDGEPTNVAVAEDKSLAIMYFENVADPDDPQRLGSIATSLLIADLSESRFVSVVSSQRLRDVLTQLGHTGGGRMDPDVATQVATKAGARWMLMGTILRTEPSMVVTSELVDVESGQVAASQRIAGDEGEEIFDIVDRLTVEVKRDLALPTEAMSEPDRPVAEMTSHSQEAYRYYMEGVESFHQLLNADASAKFTQALAIDSTLAAAWLRIGLEEFFSSRGYIDPEPLKKAVEYANRAGNLDRFYIDAFAKAANGNDRQAVTTLEEARQLFPDEKELHLFLGTIKAFRMYDSQGGIADLERVVAMDPTYKIAWNYLAYEYAQIGDRDRSEAAFNRYISIVPDEANPYDTAADLYVLWGDTRKGIETYEIALQKASRMYWSQRKLGVTYMFVDEYEKSMELFRKVATSDNANVRPEGWMILGFPSMRQGKYFDALEAFDRAVAFLEVEQGVDERDVLVDVYRAIVLWEQGKRTEALETMESLNPGWEETLKSGWYEHNLVKMLVEVGDFERANEIATLIAERLSGELTHRRSYYYAALGTIEMGRGNLDAAIKHFERGCALTKVATNSWGWLQSHLARAYLEAGRYQDAIETYEPILERNANSFNLMIEGVKGYYFLGVAYEKSGNPQKALVSYDRFLTIWQNGDPGLPFVADARDRVRKLRAGS